LVKNKGAKVETPKGQVYNYTVTKPCETKTVTSYSVKTLTKSLLLRLAWV
jgi:hypothetical protein